MRALLLMAHGSPREEANEVVARVADLLRKDASYARVEVGYLDVNEPTIPAAIEKCVREGASEIIAVPYLLHSGKHMMRDIPDLLERAQHTYEGVRILMSDYVATDPLLDSVLLDRVREATSQ